MFASSIRRSDRKTVRLQRSRSRAERAAHLFLLVVSFSFLLAACQSGPDSQAANQGSTPTDQPNTASSATATPVPQPMGRTGNWNMIFHDEFDGNSLDTSKWTTCYFNFKVGNNSCDHDQSELELYQPSNVSVSNGVLTLKAEKQTVHAANGQTYKYTSGMISTGPTSADSKNTRFAFKYGYMEMRAKVPSGQGMWPAFWTLPTNLQWPPEIDVFEILGNTPNIIHMHYHYPNGDDGGADDGKTWQGPNFSDDWHTYAVDWEPDAITWYVDGVPRRTYTDTSNITSNKMYLIANLAVGGDWPGNPGASTHFPASYQIDYIRVWQKQ